MTMCLYTLEYQVCQPKWTFGYLGIITVVVKVVLATKINKPFISKESSLQT